MRSKTNIQSYQDPRTVDPITPTDVNNLNLIWATNGFECPEGQGPNPKTRDRESNTLCEVCSDRLLISEGGVCVPPG